MPVTLLLTLVLLGVVGSESAAAGAEDVALEYDLEGMDFLARDRLCSFILDAPPSPDDCRCLARDGDHLWVGTPAGAVRWNTKDNTHLIIRAEEDWGKDVPDLDTPYVTPPPGEEMAFKSGVGAYMERWLRNAVTRIVVLTPGNIWLGTCNGAIVVRDGKAESFNSHEEALAALRHTELKSQLGKLVAMDGQGDLWWTREVEGYYGPVELRRYDGERWRTMRQARDIKGNRSSRSRNIVSIAADAQGRLWACGEGGIYARGDARWDIADPARESQEFQQMFTSPSGALSAFGRGTIARLDGDVWRRFRAEGIYEGITPSDPGPGGARPIVEVGDRLYFIAFTPTSGQPVACYDGERVRFLPRIRYASAIAAAPNGDILAAEGSYEGQQLLRYAQDKKVESIALPREFGDGQQVDRQFIVQDILADADGTLWLATQAGLFKRTAGGDWERLLCGEDTGAEKEPEPQVPSFGLEKEVTPEAVNQLYELYMTKAGKKLAAATNDELAEDITSAENVMFSAISYRRLLRRDERRAAKCLDKAVERFCKEGAGQEGGWATAIQFGYYGVGIAESLLRVAKSREGATRRVAILALYWRREPPIVLGLLSLLDRCRDDPEAYVDIAVAAASANDSRGLRVLIETATHRGITETDAVTTAQSMLSRFVADYDDVPENWDAAAWDAWWRKHESTWTRPAPGSDERDFIRLVGNERILVEQIADKMDAEAEAPKPPGAE
jgi:hypothetical protein